MTKGFTIPATKVGSLRGYNIESMADVEALEKLGIIFDASAMRGISNLAMDSLPLAGLSTSSVTTPIQFLQAWLPGFVETVTRARKIDNLIGITTIGKWSDEEVVQGYSERSGRATPYSDNANIPYSNWNVNFNRATIVRFEQGIRVDRLAEARASEMNYNDAEAKRKGAALSLEISRDLIGFYGFNSGANRTYGFLNAPGLPAYVDVAAGASTDTEWTGKTTLEIIKDILTAAAALRSQSGDLIDVKKDALTLALPTRRLDLLSTPTEFGYSVQKWMADNYPNIRFESAPKLQEANGGEDVMYLYADKYAEDSTDDGLTFTQMVPAKFMTLGVAQQAKGYEEDYLNATAGVMCKRPWAVVRYTAI